MYKLKIASQNILYNLLKTTAAADFRNDFNLTELFILAMQ